MGTEVTILGRLEQRVSLAAGSASLEGTLAVPERCGAIVLFAHGTGSGRHSPRNRFVAEVLADAGLGTLLVDLLTEAEEREEAQSGHLRFDIDLLTDRLLAATEWIGQDPRTQPLSVGLFGASTGAAAALRAAARRPQVVRAVVSRGGRPDLARPALADVRAPTLLIVGGDDTPVIGMNEAAMARLRTPAHLEIVPGATHLFEEEGALEQVALLARNWFLRHLAPVGARSGD
jgi:putative phosphoribosyl transferase